MTLKTYVFTAPSPWASYLVNADASGIPDAERELCDAWLARENMGGACVSCVDLGFRRWNDATGSSTAGDVSQYMFLIEESLK